MPLVSEVDISPLSPDRFETVIGDRFEEFAAAIERAKVLFDGRIVWNVNSTARGGGVAEMLRSLIAYAEGAGVATRWVVIQGDPEFFKITKRIHNHLHGAPGDGGDLGSREQDAYMSTLRRNADELAAMLKPGDVVILHDPQTAGLAATLKAAGATVIWRCHVGLDTPNDIARNAWRFLHGHVIESDSYIFSRQAFVWEDLPDERIAIIPPSIDAFSPKNQEMSADNVRAILRASALVDGSPEVRPEYERIDGRRREVERRADVTGGPLPDGPDAVVQVSRWDRLKDPVGVIRGFVDHVAPATEAHLMLAGPSVESVADDPEGAEVLEEAVAVWDQLQPDLQARVHLAALPMDDGEENAAIVNALQRHATVVVQKSLAEGFGLTVAEAMWKARPVVASKIGGIQDQIEDRVTGILVDDPTDLQEYGSDVLGLLNDAGLAESMGGRAQERVRSDFLGPRHLMQYLELIAKLIE